MYRLKPFFRHFSFKNMTATQYYHQFSRLQLPPHIYHLLKKSWLSYVRLQLEDEGKPSYLPSIERSGSNRYCLCNKGSISYPHWPPSSYEESIDQLFIFLLHPRPSRPTLAFCWLSFIQKDPKDSENMLSLAQRSCPIFSLSWPSKEPKQMSTWQRDDCANFCESVLEEGTCYCLCCCPYHREECPAHRLVSDRLFFLWFAIDFSQVRRWDVRQRSSKHINLFEYYLHIRTELVCQRNIRSNATNLTPDEGLTALRGDDRVVQGVGRGYRKW